MWHHLVRRSLAVFSIAAIASLLPISASAATFVVSNKNDAGVGSLRQAVADANALTGADTISFASGLRGTILLTSGQLDVTDDLTISGPGRGAIKISGGGQSRLFEVAAGGSLNVSSLTLTRASASDWYDGYGGCIRFHAPVTIADVVMSYCRADGYDDGGGHGGAIWTDAPLTVSKSLFTNNVAGRAGSGITARAGASISDSRFTYNGTHDGAGSIEGSTIALLRTVITHNYSVSGEVWAYTSLTMKGSTVSYNGSDINGPAVWTPTILMANSKIIGTKDGNGLTVGGGTIGGSVIADNCCGGIIHDGGTLTIRGTTISGNGPAIAYLAGQQDWSYVGAGVFNASGTVSITGSSITGNDATNAYADGLGGGVYNAVSISGDPSVVKLIRTSVTGNSAVRGGGIYNEARLILTAATIQNNTATGGLGSGGGVFNATSGTVVRDADTVISANTPDDCVGC